MRLTFHGSVLILGGSSELGRALALALRAEGAQVCCVCRDDTGCARCAQDGLPALVLADPETLPARCEALLGLPVGHLADLLHSRFEQLVARAMPAGRCLGPDDVLPGLCFLLSAEAAAINGSVVTLDGGLGALKLPEL